MGLLGRRKGRPGTLRTADSADLQHLREFIATREGVEAYLEPQTTVTATTVVLVATTGEWTRRRVDGPAAAAAFATKQRIPIYDVAKVGYPKRMREWTELRKQQEPAELRKQQESAELRKQQEPVERRAGSDGAGA